MVTTTFAMRQEMLRLAVMVLVAMDGKTGSGYIDQKKTNKFLTSSIKTLTILTKKGIAGSGTKKSNASTTFAKSKAAVFLLAMNSNTLSGTINSKLMTISSSRIIQYMEILPKMKFKNFTMNISALLRIMNTTATTTFAKALTAVVALLLMTALPSTMALTAAMFQYAGSKKTGDGTSNAIMLYLLT